MKSLKKIIAAALVLLMLLTVAGCGGSSTTNDGDLGGGGTNNDTNGGTTGAATGVTLSQNLMDFTIKIDGVVYKLPMALSVFEGNGWSLPSYFDKTKTLNSGAYTSAKLEKSGKTLDVELYNHTEDAQSAASCPVGRINFNFPCAADIYLAGNLHLNTATLKDVTGKYGEPTSQNTYGDTTEVLYDKAGSTSVYERYTFTFNASGTIERVSIVNFVQPESSSGNSDGDENEAGYQAPAALGTDPASFTVSVMGELYTLPAPVSAFVENGWEILSTEAIGAGAYNDRISFSKNGKTFVFGVLNLSDRQADAANCDVYKITEATYENQDLELIVPGNIRIGSSAADAANAYASLDSNDSDTSVEYTINTYAHMFRVYVSKDTQTVTSITVINRTRDGR